MKTLKIVALIYIVCRVAADVTGFLSTKSTIEMVNGMGWPVNEFWIFTVLPVVCVMLLNCFLIILGESPHNVYFLTTMVLIPLGWAIYLLLYKESTAWMYIDGTTWVFVVIASLILYLPDKK
jgi:hypothetical protein